MGLFRSSDLWILRANQVRKAKWKRMGKWRGKWRPLSRQGPRIAPRPRILVVCEGEVTEPEYLRALKNHHRVQTVEVEIIRHKGVPKSVVEHAVKMSEDARKEAKTYKNSFLAYDKVWCVFDVDEHPNLAEA